MQEVFVFMALPRLEWLHSHESFLFILPLTPWLYRAEALPSPLPIAIRGRSFLIPNPQRWGALALVPSKILKLAEDFKKNLNLLKLSFNMESTMSEKWNHDAIFYTD